MWSLIPLQSTILIVISNNSFPLEWLDLSFDSLFLLFNRAMTVNSTNFCNSKSSLTYLWTFRLAGSRWLKVVFVSKLSTHFFQSVLSVFVVIRNRIFFIYKDRDYFFSWLSSRELRKDLSYIVLLCMLVVFSFELLTVCLWIFLLASKTLFSGFVSFSDMFSLVPTCFMIMTAWFPFDTES